MIEVKLEDFQKHRKQLLKQASNLLRNRGFGFKTDLIKTLSEDIVQNTYVEFQRTFSNSFVTEKHFENFLRSVLYTQYQLAIDTNRRGGQYLLFKKGEFDQMDVTKFDKVYTQEEFDTISSFKKYLSESEIEFLDYLLDGYSKVDISKETSIPIHVVKRTVDTIRTKYKDYESRGN